MNELEKLKEKKLEILKELDRVCKQANVRYYLAYGTLLGAVRHGGYIPWDDDIDVFIVYDQFEKLYQHRDLFAERYFLQTRDSDPNYTNMKRALRDSSTALFINADDCNDINHGIYIDIYILYPYPDNWFQAHKLIIDSYILRLLYLGRQPKNHGQLGRLISNIVFKVYNGKRAERKIKKIESSLEKNGGTKYYASYFGDDITPLSCFKFPQESFLEPREMVFEDFLAPCPENPEEICRITYGPTFMEYPPEEKRKPQHNNMYVNFEESYQHYKGQYY